jgi:hypothetical protein
MGDGPAPAAVIPPTTPQGTIAHTVSEGQPQEAEMAVRATLLQTRVPVLLFLGAAATVVAVPAAQAQLVEIHPIAGFSLPTRISLQDGTIHLRQKVGFRVGARMTLTFNDRFDLTNIITYIPGYVSLHGGGERFEITSGSHSLAGATSARYWIRPPDRPLSWEVHTGLAMVFGGHTSYLDLFDSSTLSAVLGSAVRYQWGRIVSFTLRVQQRLLRIRFGDQAAGGSRPFQVALGVGFPFLEQLH